MGQAPQQPGILTSISEELGAQFPRTLLEDGPIIPHANIKVKNKKNARAAGIARSQGAQTTNEKVLQGVIDGQQVLIEKKNQQISSKKIESNVNTLMDKMGALPPDQLFSEQSFENVKRILPNLTKEQYFNALAPNSARRASLTKQLATLPIGTPLSKQTLDQLVNVGINDPNKYMSISVIEPPSTILGAIQQTALSEAAAGETTSPLFAAGVGFQRQQAAVDKATESVLASDLISAKGNAQALRDQIKSTGPLNTKQKFDAGKALRDDIRKGFKTINIQFEFWQNINKFSDPSKATKTFRLTDNDTLQGGIEIVDPNKNFQNVSDIALIYSFIKMLDPDSVVREGEIKLADRSTGFLTGIKVKAANILRGETLDPQQRAGILNVANQTLLSGAQGIQGLIDNVDENIQEFGLNRKTVIGKREENIIKQVDRIRKAQAQIQQPSPGQTSQTGTIGNIKFEILPD